MLSNEVAELREKGVSEEEIQKMATERCPNNELYEPQDIKDEVLRNNSPAKKEVTDISGMTYPELKAKAKELSLKTTGKKAELVARITKHLGEGK